MSSIPEKFDESYYDKDYFVTKEGKKFKNTDGSEGAWSYANPEGEWLGCKPIVEAWKDIFGCKNMLDIGCGRGTFIGYARASGIIASGFDFSKWAVANRYSRCDPSWISCKDATEKWDYEGKSFDLVTVLDLLEHLYSDDIDKVINEMYRVSKKWIFLQIATIGGGSGSGIHDGGYILSKGEKVPIELESMVIAGHVTVQNKQFWINKLKRNGWKFRDDVILEFIRRVPIEVIANWVKNTIIIMERV